jgi:hypothetical protein
MKKLDYSPQHLIFMLPEKLSGDHTVAVVSVCPYKPICSPPKITGEHTVTVVSVRLCPSVRAHLLNLSSEIDVDIKCSFRQGLVDQGLSRPHWKGQGHSEHIKEKSNFNISSYNLSKILTWDLQKHILNV